ncbi:MAG TPA: 2-oxoacid:acceptor oxidoreductase family protein, partial [Victivallales bacterium]|nr:2-oxoacid:acceptor oxidoreductase family protein [Victivallales bacterium]
EVTWLPSYGPEMRGGTANCSIAISSKKIPSPIVEKADLMIVFSQQAMDKFASEMEAGGYILFDKNNVVSTGKNEKSCAIFGLNASEHAKNIGDPRIANTLMLGALSSFVKQIDRGAFLRAIRKAFARKEKVLDINLRAFGEGEKLISNLIGREKCSQKE